MARVNIGPHEEDQRHEGQTSDEFATQTGLDTKEKVLLTPA